MVVVLLLGLKAKEYEFYYQNENVYSAFELKVLIIELVLMLLLGLIASNISPSDSISGYLNEGGRVGVGGGGINEKNLDGVF